MRSEFEKAFPIHAHWIVFDEKTNKNYCPYVADAKAGEYQSMWKVWQHQQSKVDELQKQLNERDLRIKRLIESEENIARGCESWRNSCSKLWKIEDAVTNVLKSIRKELEHGHLSDDESQTLSSYANDLEQALKGEG